MSKRWNRHFDPREVYGQKICQMGAERPECIAMTADLAYSTRASQFMETCPTRFINAGIAEQNMVGMAAGLAMEGKVPWLSSLAAFITMRCFEQVRTDICYNNFHVVLVGVMGGVSAAPLGTTHYATEDIGIFRPLANMTILHPADQWEIEKAMEAAMDAKGPIYIRLGVGSEPHLLVERKGFKIGQAFTFKEGTDASLIATGFMVHKAIEAAEILEKKGLSIGIYDHPTIKPLDVPSVLKAAKHSKVVVTLEEHNVIGGLGSAVAEVLAEVGHAVPLKRMGIPDLFAGVGSREDLLSKYGLDVPAIVRCVENSLKK